MTANREVAAHIMLQNLRVLYESDRNVGYALDIAQAVMYACGVENYTPEEEAGEKFIKALGFLAGMAVDDWEMAPHPHTRASLIRRVAFSEYSTPF
jgi:hypothetical protein